MLSDDWTKQLHLQSDRHVELHGQGGHQARVRIPKFGRAMGYHFPSADAVIGASGNEVYRLNLEQGRFLAPYVLEGSGRTGTSDVLGVNSIDVNPAHGLMSFGTESTAGIVEMWDPRARRRAGALSAATPTVLDAAWSHVRSHALPGVFDASDVAKTAGENTIPLSVTALKSAQDGLNLAVGTSTGHTLLYDLRMARAYATKDQGYGVPIKSLAWPGDQSVKSFYSGGRSLADMARGEQAEGTVLSADSKGIKVWKKDQPTENVVNITPPVGSSGTSYDLNDVHHVPGTGLILAAVEATQMAAWYVPALGPAPKWCSFLDSLTDELDTEEVSGTRRGVYENFKFVDRAELERLGMDGLIGTDLLRPYMHGYFVTVGLYEKAKLIANPTLYQDARERAIKARLDKEAESRIRKKDDSQTAKAAKVKVNQHLADKVESAQQQPSRKKKDTKGPTLLEDDRFKDLFSNPEFEIDQESREFQLRNPGAVPQEPRISTREPLALRDPATQKKTAVEEEMDHSGPSEDEDAFAFAHRPEVPDSDAEAEGESGAGVHRGAHLQESSDEEADAFSSGGARKKSFKERMQARQTPNSGASWRKGAKRGTRGDDSMDMDSEAGEDGNELTWTPAGEAAENEYDSDEQAAQFKSKSRSKGKGTGAEDGTRKKDKTFGAGLSKGAGTEEGVGLDGLSHDDRFGRSKRRNTSRSASRNAMRSR